MWSISWSQVWHESMTRITEHTQNGFDLKKKKVYHIHWLRIHIVCHQFKKASRINKAEMTTKSIISPSFLLLRRWWSCRQAEDMLSWKLGPSEGLRRCWTRWDGHQCRRSIIILSEATLPLLCIRNQTFGTECRMQAQFVWLNISKKGWDKCYMKFGSWKNIWIIDMSYCI